MSDDLQFEKAEYAAPQAMVCSSCQAPITREYFAVNGKVLCESCAAAVRRHLEGQGAGAGRFLTALLLGLGAAALGTAVYAGVMIGAHTEWALISIGIGYFVGKAVRMGSGNRGGVHYQLLAAALTYTSICAAYAAGRYDFDLPAGSQLPELAMMMYKLPFQEGAGNIIGWLIIGFGVWQAWKMNTGVRVQITGPHALGASTARA